jgi:hypothetical protein
MRKVIAEVGALYLRVAICVLAVIGLFALVGVRMGWFEPEMPSVKQVLFNDAPQQFIGYKPFFSRRILVDTGREYRVRVAVRVLPKPDGSPQTSRVYLGVETFDENGKPLTSGPGPHRFAGASNLRVSSDDGWTNISGIITNEGDESHNQFRPGTKFVRVVLMVNYKADESVISEVRDLRFSELIPLQE